jgi:predicted transcriptional regulator
MSLRESEDPYILTLIKLHDLVAVDEKSAKSIEEIAEEIKKSYHDVEKVLSILKRYEHVSEIGTGERTKKYYLTAKGIVAACSYYS